MADSRIYLSSPHIGEAELGLVCEAFASNWIAPVGPHVDAFEREFAAISGAPYAVALSSGTAALHMGLRWLDLEPGDEVFCSTLTFSASVNPILYEGAVPVFIDSDESSWNMDPQLLAEALKKRVSQGKRPKAVIVVHLYGQSADLDPLLAACQEFEVPLIEDAAEALGATYKNRLPGAVGLCGIHSFNGNKIITTSGGGMLISHEPKLVEKARFWATQARDPAPHYQHSEVGFNYRLSNVLAAIGRGQLRVLPERVKLRRRNFAYYQEALGHLQGLSFMPEADYGKCTRWLTAVLVDPHVSGVNREVIRKALDAANIEARPVWKPMHLQPVFRDYSVFGGIISEKLFENGLCLPSGSNLSIDDLDRVISVIKSVWTDR